MLVHTNTTALDRIMRARAELIMTQTFYGVLVSQVTPIISKSVPTAATNGKQHYWNPDYIAKLTQEEVLGVQAHESEHDGRRHHTRRGWRDPIHWNEAADYAINVDLIDHGFKLPKGALVDAKYRGMSAEDIYREREIERAEKEKADKERADEEEKRKSQKSEEGDDGESDEDEASKPDAGDDETGDETGDETDNGDNGEGDETGDETGDKPGTDAGDETGDEAEGDGGGKSDDEADAEGNGEGGAGEGDDDEAGAGEGVGGNGDGEPGEGEPSMPEWVETYDDMGAVLDAAEATAEMASEDAKWETMLRQAAMLAAKRGDAPGHVAREIETADHPPKDWREQLRQFFDGGATTIQTWARPNRRFIGGGLYLPGNMRDGVNKVVFLIDTSGSVTYYPGALEAIKIETQAALDEGVIDQAVVLYGDTRVTRVDEYRNGDEIEFDPRGGGGTDLAPMFKHVADEIDDASLIVGFTDLEIGNPGPEPSCPVLWAVVGYPSNVKRYMANTPWGAAAIEVRPDHPTS